MAIQKRGAGPREKEAAITELARTGNPVKAAAAAGLSLFELRDLRKRDKQFDEALKEAKETYVENLEESLVEMGRARGNPLPIFGRLKKERPQEWHDKLQQTTVNVNNNVSVPAEEVVALLIAGFQNATEETKRVLLGDVIDAPVIKVTDGRPDESQVR